jgi:hypothetical protein
MADQGAVAAGITDRPLLLLPQVLVHQDKVLLVALETTTEQIWFLVAVAAQGP